MTVATATTDARRKPDKEEGVLKYFEKHPEASYREIAEVFKTSHAQVKRWVDKAGKVRKVKFIDKKELPDEMDAEDLFDQIIAVNNGLMDRDLKQTKVTVRLEDDKPIAIAFTGDWHLGAKGADYELFKKHMELLEQTDGLYAVGLGDYKDNANAFIHKDSVTEVVIPPYAQEVFVKHFIRQISPLVLVRGCHDHWDHKTGNRDFIQELCTDCGAVNLWHGGSVTLLLGEQEYKIRCRHKFRGESGLNVTNVLRRMEDTFGPADVQMLGHKHDPYMFETESKGQPVIWGRCGSYKRYDEYGQQLAGYRGKEAIPVVIFWPDRHKTLGFQKIEDAVDYLGMLRVENKKIVEGMVL